MSFSQYNSSLTGEFLGEGDYYVFSAKQGKEICLAYLYTTWCGSPCGNYLKLSSVELGKPLPLVRSGDSPYDKGQLKAFKIDSSYIQLIDDLYKRVESWIYNIERQIKYPHLSQGVSCTTAIIQVKHGVLFAHYTNADVYKQSIF